MLRYLRIHRVASFSRCLLEILAVITILSWSSAHFPVALRLSAADILHGISTVFVSPRFVFFLGNAIILTLFAKSGHFSNSSSASSYPAPSSAAVATTDGGGGEGDLYEEFLGISTESHSFFSSYFSTSPPPSIWFHQQEEKKEEEELYEDKAAVCVEPTNSHTATTKRGLKGGFRRTRSADLVKKPPGGLRRSETDVANPNAVVLLEEEKQKAVEAHYWSEKKDDDDGDEFRRTIEEFIWKQLQFIKREEEESILREKEEEKKKLGEMSLLELN